VLSGGEPPRAVINMDGRTMVTRDRDDLVDALTSGVVRPAREFKSVVGDRHTPQIPFLARLGRQERVETNLERVNAHFLDRDPVVADLVPQGLWIERSGGRPGWACPDFLVLRTDGSLVAVEVKTHKSFAHPGTRSRLRAVGAACLRLGMDYEVWCELTPVQRMMYERQQSLDRVPPFATPPPVHVDQEILWRAKDATTFGALRASVDVGLADFLPAFWRLCWSGALCLDWERKFTASSVVRPHGPSCRGAGTRVTSWSGICGPGLETHRYTRRGFVA
jgi:hypothetical protein